jgi:hypothetical protein
MARPMNFLRCLIGLLALAAIHSSSAADAVRTRDHLRGTRYGEIIVVTGGPLTFVGHVYNTLGLNDCPEAQ